MRPLGILARRRFLLAEKPWAGLPLPVLGSWIHAFLTWFLVYTYTYPMCSFAWRAGFKRTATVLASQEVFSGLTVCGLGVVVSCAFLIFLVCEFLRAEAAIRSQLTFRMAYLASAVLMIDCALFWDSASWYFEQFMK